MNPRRAWPAAILAAVLATAGCGGTDAAAQSELRVAAASSLTFVLEDIVADFESEHPDQQVSVSFGSSGALLQQIDNGAPFDVYLAADAGYVTRLVDLGNAESAQVFDYATGRLALWASADSGVDVTAGLGALADARTVAIANPDHAPYGEAAQEAIESAGIATRVSDRLVLGENVAQAAEFARSGNAEAAVIALPLALAPELRDTGDHWEVPREEFGPLRHQGAVLGGGGESDRADGPARRFADFLRSEPALRRFDDGGFGPPADAG